MKRSYILLLLLISTLIYSQKYELKTGNNTGIDDRFYMGFGTSVSTFLGGEFGKTFALRLNYSPDYYNDNYYSYDHYSYDNNDSYLMYSPIQLDVNLGYFIGNKAAVELESSFIWHMRGRPDPDLVTGTEFDMDYIDKNDNSRLFAIPLLLNVKFYPMGRLNSPFYIKGGAGFQYVSESSERIREFYAYNEYYYHYYSSSYILERYQRSAFLPGFKVGAGVSYSFFNNINAFSEIEYSYFSNSGTKGTTPLALDKARYTGMLAFNTKVYFSF
jgi:opacity protein-like surface antigen